MRTVWIYIDKDKPAGDPNQVVVFESFEAAEAWFESYDEDGVACEYSVIELEKRN